MNAQVPSYVPTNGLVAYYPFSGNANDESANGNNGTVNGASLTTDRFGNINKAYYFNGQSSITANSTKEISNNINNELSISVWFKLDSYFNGITSDFSPLISKNGPFWHQYEFFVSSTGIGFWGPNIYQEVNFQFTLNDWHNIIIVFNSGIIKYYSNGVLVGTNTVPVSSLQPSGGSVLEIGMDTANQVEYLNGSIDDIGIWNRALTQQEVATLYNAEQCFNNITVTDTLIINVGQLSYSNPITYANNITISPNPASTQININFNNISNLNGGILKIINSSGQQVATTQITTYGTQSIMQLAAWGGSGLYFVQIVNPQGQIVDIKKILLQ
jgi:hypothetical protein